MINYEEEIFTNLIPKIKTYGTGTPSIKVKYVKNISSEKGAKMDLPLLCTYTRSSRFFDFLAQFWICWNFDMVFMTVFSMPGRSLFFYFQTLRALFKGLKKPLSGALKKRLKKNWKWRKGLRPVIEKNENFLV